MRATLIRRTSVAAAAVSLALLGTACSAGKSGDEGAGKGKESGAAEPGAVRAPSAAELEKLVLAQGDVAGHKVTKAGPGDTLTAKDITVDKAQCEPIARLIAGVAAGEPAAEVKRKVLEEPKKGDSVEDIAAAFDVTLTMPVLGSYEAKGAEETFAALRTAATACAGGFQVTVRGTQRKVLSVTGTPLTGGDEAAAWTVVTEQEGDRMPVKIAAVRKGAVIAGFYAMNVMAAGAGKDYELPKVVVDAQVAKLG
ncbi:hypothetical protein [Streptomyces sp. NPDC006368]|uniref:hypothetical protein n=1 Tax=Streptomyces sp. NPDC006368 TaxID=3156760 RepID=UPI0033B95E7E